MTGFPELTGYLSGWAGGDALRRAVSGAILALSSAGIEIARVIARGPLAGDVTAPRGEQAGGGGQKPLEFIANETVLDALKNAPVASVGSAENAHAIKLREGAPLAVNIHPLDGSSNIGANMTAGSIFSILPAAAPDPLLQPGFRQIAAGFIAYGPQTALALTVGQGTQIFWLEPQSGEWLLAAPDIQIPADTREYAVNASNRRHWDESLRAYIDDCLAGGKGPRRDDFTMHWLGSLVAEAFHILLRGGVYLYPGDARQGYRDGRLRLLYEANPIGMIIEQAGGACSNGSQRILDVEPRSLHQRVPLIFGSLNEVNEVIHYLQKPQSIGARSPLFASRGLFRS